MAIFLPAEWMPQSGVQLTWPHEDTDWNYILNDVTECYINIAREIAKREKLLIVCKDEQKVRSQLGDIVTENVFFREVATNDTWARDHGPISVFVDGVPYLYDFQFNGWGLKFPANLDNQITRELYISETYPKNVGYLNMLYYVLEGGSIESDGSGTLLTTSNCLLSMNRNDHLPQSEIENFLKQVFGVERILWLNHGYLMGDDTDSHVDTLARFCDFDTIAYVKCTDTSDEHYDELSKMEEDLKAMVTLQGEPYNLIPLPLPDPCYEDDFRLPATYANFLIINGAVLMPTYNSSKDEEAKKALQEAFPKHEIIGIDCTSLIRQHGSLHCVTMQMPYGML